jgi:hypothetical protein
MSEENANIAWFKNLFTKESSTENIILFIKNIFKLEQIIKIDIIKTLENTIDVNSFNFTRIDVLDGLNILECIIKNIETNEKNIEVFLNDNQSFLKKYNINTNIFNNVLFQNMSFSSILHILSIIGQKKNNQLIQEKDLCSIVKTVPDIVCNNTVVLADLINEVASLCITTSTRSEIKIHVNDLNDIRISIDTASLINNIRELLKSNDNLSDIVGKSYNIEISSKLTQGIMNHK